MSVMQHLYVDRIDLVFDGITTAFLGAIVNGINDNFRLLYIKNADASESMG